MKRDPATKPNGKSKLERNGNRPIEATHPHTPPVAWCKKCHS